MKYNHSSCFTNYAKSCSWRIMRMSCHCERIRIIYLLKISLFSNTGCAAALGMENKGIPDANIRLSSQLDGNHSAKEARLNSKADWHKGGGWSALSNNFNQWLQVDISGNLQVTGVATQGMNGKNQWVSRYRIQYSSDGVTFEFYNATEDSSAKVWLLLKGTKRFATWPHFDSSAYFKWSS